LRLIGFTYIRNGIKYDYPFQECIRSLQGLCDSTTVVVGKSEDGTEAAVSEMGQLDIVPSVWDERLRKSGLILSQQTNLGIEAMRKAEQDRGSGDDVWVVHLQADEILHEREYEQIKKDIQTANDQGCDAVRSRYIHFWLKYDQIAYAKRWYAHEIRIFRLHSHAKSFGDAQGIGDVTKVFESNSHVFHYGHVRTAEAYTLKKRDFHRWWHSDEKMKRMAAQGDKSDRKEPTLKYFGTHPKVMHHRIKTQALTQTPRPPASVVVYDPDHLTENVFKNKLIGIRQKTIFDPKDLSNTPNVQCVLLGDLTFFQRLRLGFSLRSRVPKSMRSPLARPWEPEFFAAMRFSEREIPVQYP